MLNGRGEEWERKHEDDCWGRHAGNSYICILCIYIYRGTIMNSCCIVKSSFYMFLLVVSRDALTQTAERNPKGNLSAIPCQSVCQ